MSRRENQRLLEEIEAVGRMRLTGAPSVLLLDEPALLSPAGSVPSRLLAKLRVLALHEGMRIFVLSRDGSEAGPLVATTPYLTAVASVGDIPRDGPVMVILTNEQSLPPNVYAWYVGGGTAPAVFHGTRLKGPRATNEILALFGTAELQERAGFAFRAAGAGEAIPEDAPFNRRILDGVSRAVADHPARVEELEQRPAGTVDLDRDVESLISAALPPILACQAPNGAVAAAPAPRNPSEPNYWFFWQRDAGNTVLGLLRLLAHERFARFHGVVRTFIARYVDFVERLPRRPGMSIAQLGVSRFQMDGKPIESYGSPQKDGPATTVLAVSAALDDEERAWHVCKPYLEYLCQRIIGPTFDPWEFAVGEIFYDYNLARRALLRGTALAVAQGDAIAEERYRARGDELQKLLGDFLSLEPRYIVRGREFLQPWMGTISGLDIGVVGSVLVAHDARDTFLTVEDPSLERTMGALEEAFADRWPVNVAWRGTGREGMGMGRFPEDANDGKGSTGGNPWTFATLWAAEYYLRKAVRGKVASQALLHRADGFLQFVLDHVPPDALTEQIDGQTGAPRGARKLAWAQSELVNALLHRHEVVSQLEASDETVQ